jgi:PIN domain nuclease of toxin-antitoxin system
MPTRKVAALPLVLDTHVWIWLMDQQTRELSRAAVEAIRHASRETVVYVSAMSLWEVSMLTARKRVSLSLDCLAWVQQAMRAPGVQVAALTASIAVDSTRLPGNPHGDPADRVIMATARQLGARLVTCDRRILAYAEAEQALAVLDARP